LIEKKKNKNNHIGLVNNISLYNFQFIFTLVMKSKRKKKKYEWLNDVEGKNTELTLLLFRDFSHSYLSLILALHPFLDHILTQTT